MSSVDWQFILAKLKRRGFTQQGLAALCGCAQSTISDLARGANKSPSYDIGAELVKLASHADEAKETA